MIDTLINWMAEPRVAWSAFAILAAWHALRMSYNKFVREEMRSEIGRLKHDVADARNEVSSLKFAMTDKAPAEESKPDVYSSLYAATFSNPKPKPKKKAKKKPKPKPKPKSEDRWDELLPGEPE